MTMPWVRSTSFCVAIWLTFAASSAIGQPNSLAQWEAAAEPIGVESSKRPIAPISVPLLLRLQAAEAEKNNDWEQALAIYKELHRRDRANPELRAKVNFALRYVQQIRRHRDPRFKEFVASQTVSDAITLFGEIIAKLPTVFVDPARSTPQHLWGNAIEELDRALGRADFRVLALTAKHEKEIESFQYRLRNTWSKRTVVDARTARDSLKQLLASAQDSLHTQLPSVIAIEMVCGACAGLDEFTVFLTPNRSSSSREAIADLHAYGVMVKAQFDAIVVEAIVNGSWAAYQTTLRKGDRLITVNGRAVHSLAALVDALRSRAMGFHEIEIAPAMPDSLPPLLRLPVEVPSVFGGRIINPKDGIGLIRIGTFNNSTPTQLTETIAQLKHEGLRSLIIDLRGNYGGSFLSGVETARRFLPHGLIVTTQGQLDHVSGQVFSSDSGMAALDLPLVLLVDSETASAAEVVAAALRDNERATLVGLPTFGKGTVQYPMLLNSLDGFEPGTPNKSGTLRVTIARLIAPNGTSIHGSGVVPHMTASDPAKQLELAIFRAIELSQNAMPPFLPNIDR